MPSRRVTRKISRLPARETAICRRFKAARERLGVDQLTVARRLGVKREFISSLEKFRSPVRFDIALRFCREFIVSEEWLATGEFKALAAAAMKRNLSGSGLHEIFFRLCFDLWSEPLTRTIPPRTLFSAAFDKFLSPLNAGLAEGNFYSPRLLPNPHDGVEIARTILNAHIDGRLFMLANEARGRGLDDAMFQRQFLRRLFEFSEGCWREMMGLPAAKVPASAGSAKPEKAKLPRAVKK